MCTDHGWCYLTSLYLKHIVPFCYTLPFQLPFNFKFKSVVPYENVWFNNEVITLTTTVFLDS